MHHPSPTDQGIPWGARLKQRRRAVVEINTTLARTTLENTVSTVLSNSVTRASFLSQHLIPQILYSNRTILGILQIKGSRTAEEASRSSLQHPLQESYASSPGQMAEWLWR